MSKVSFQIWKVKIQVLLIFHPLSIWYAVTNGKRLFIDFDCFIYFGDGKIVQSMGHALWKFSKTFMCYLLVES